MSQSLMNGLIYGRTLPNQSPSSDFAPQNYKIILTYTNKKCFLPRKSIVKENCYHFADVSKMVRFLYLSVSETTRIILSI